VEAEMLGTANTAGRAQTVLPAAGGFGWDGRGMAPAAAGGFGWDSATA
jgi:hypothetical protein